MGGSLANPLANERRWKEKLLRNSLRWWLEAIEAGATNEGSTT
jgi:hypothetical protein